MSKKHRFYIEREGTKWVLRENLGISNLLGTYRTRDDARFALKTKRLQQMCDDSEKARGVFQPSVA